MTHLLMCEAMQTSGGTGGEAREELLLHSWIQTVASLPGEMRRKLSCILKNSTVIKVPLHILGEGVAVAEGIFFNPVKQC